MLSLLVCSKEDRSYWLQLKKGSMDRAKNQQLLQVWSLTTVVAHATNVWGGLQIHLRSDSPGKSSHSDIFYQGQCTLTGTSSRRADLVHSAQRYKSTASSPVTLTHRQHTLCISLDIHFLQCWQPPETFTGHNPRRKVRWPCYIRCFGLENISPGWPSPRVGKACISQGTTQTF